MILGFKDTPKTVAKKAGISDEQMNTILGYGEDYDTTDKELYQKVSKIMGEEKAEAYCYWVGCEDFK